MLRLESSDTCLGRLLILRLESQDTVVCGYKYPHEYHLESLSVQRRYSRDIIHLKHSSQDIVSPDS